MLSRPAVRLRLAGAVGQRTSGVHGASHGVRVVGPTRTPATGAGSPPTAACPLRRVRPAGAVLLAPGVRRPVRTDAADAEPGGPWPEIGGARTVRPSQALDRLPDRGCCGVVSQTVISGRRWSRRDTPSVRTGSRRGLIADDVVADEFSAAGGYLGAGSAVLLRREQ
jgi:hypothetical protein